MEDPFPSMCKALTCSLPLPKSQGNWFPPVFVIVPQVTMIGKLQG